VQSATWDAEGNITGVVFFAPDIIQRAQETQLRNQMLAQMGPGEMQETPEMQQLRHRIDTAQTPEMRQAYQAMYDKAKSDLIAYYSS
jgi:hypothetical protein